MPRLSLIAVIAVVFLPDVVSCQEPSQLHRIDAQTPNGLRELFHYDGHTMPLLSAHRGERCWVIPKTASKRSNIRYGIPSPFWRSICKLRKMAKSC